MIASRPLLKKYVLQDRIQVNNRQNQQGFVTLSLILFLPLILLLSFCFLWSLWFINKKNQWNNICHQAVLESQSHIIKGNKKILALNMKARLLTLEKRLLNVVILTAPPQFKVAARLRKKVVISKQKLLKVTQQKIFYQSRTLSRAPLYRLKNRFYKFKKNLGLLWDKKNVKGHLNIRPQKSALVIKHRDIAPTYKRSSWHHSQQHIRVQWFISTQDLGPTWLLSKLKQWSQWTGECKSHPHSKGGLWFPAIGGVSPL